MRYFTQRAQRALLSILFLGFTCSAQEKFPEKTKRPVLDKNIINEQISANGIVSWQLNKTVDSTRFIIQEWRWGTWYFKGEVKSYVDSTNYSFKIDTIWAGYNSVRILVLKSDSSFSKAFYYPVKTEVAIDPRCGDLLRLTTSTVYRIRNYKTGETILQGYGLVIPITQLVPNAYFLDFANITTEFIRKK